MMRSPGASVRPSSIVAEASTDDGEILLDHNSTTASASLFGTLLHFIYSDELPPSFDVKHDSLELLVLADKYGCSNLKLHCEALVVEAGITIDAAAELFLLADSHSCALLREASLDVLAANPKSALASDGWKTLEKSSLLPEVTKAFFEPPRFDDNSSGEHGSVSVLRKRLAQAGKDVDGTREMLVKRLRTLDDSEHSDNDRSD